MLADYHRYKAFLRSDHMVQVAITPRRTSLVHNRNYRWLWIGQSCSLIGDYFFVATITLWIIDQLARGASWLPLATGGVVLVVALPSLLLSPIAGVYVDRWDRRRTMIWTDVVRLAIVLLFLVMAATVANRTVLLVSCFLVLLLIACGEQFFVPSRVAVIAALVPEEQRASAYGSLQQIRYFAQIVGPAVATPLYITLGPLWAFAINALSFLVSFLATLAVRLQPQEQREPQNQGGFWGELREGVRFFVGNRILVTLLISGMLYMFGGMAFNAFEYLYGVENLHIPGAILGLYVGCYGVGVVLGLPLIAALARRWSEVEVLWICLIGNGIAMLVLSRMTMVIPGMICTLFLGCFSASIFVTVRPLTVLVTPQALIGRVMAFEVPLITIASLLGGLLASIIAATILAHFHATVAGMHFGRLDTIFAGVGLISIGAGVFARLTLYRAVVAWRIAHQP
jgi:MFS family permease